MCRNVFNMWPKTILLPVWLRDAKRLDTPGREEGSVQRGAWCRQRSCGVTPDHCTVSSEYSNPRIGVAEPMPSPDCEMQGGSSPNGIIFWKAGAL